MPAPWAGWTRILSCKQQTSIKTVQDPKKKKVKKKKTKASSSMSPAMLGAISPSPVEMRKKAWTCGQHDAAASEKKKSRSRGMAASSSTTVGTGVSGTCCNNLKSVVHGNTRVVHRSDHDSPLSYHHRTEAAAAAADPTEDEGEEAFQLLAPMDSGAYSQRQTMKLSNVNSRRISSNGGLPPSPSPVHFLASPLPLPSKRTGDGRQNSSGLSREHYSAIHHHRPHHSVTELRDGDSARSIVEIIFQTSWMRQDIPSAKPEGIYKVHNSPNALSRFEEYRDSVKAKASKTSKKNSRCLVDGNELLRFYSTTVSCNMAKSKSLSLSLSESSSSSLSELLSQSSSSSSVSLCMLPSCGVCCILRNGFPTKGYPGIYTNASSGRAHDSAQCDGGNVRAMLVCRVIAGRVKRMGIECSQDGSIPSIYDSVAGEATQYTDLEELLVFNARAVLPCFIVTYSC